MKKKNRGESSHPMGDRPVCSRTLSAVCERLRRIACSCMLQCCLKRVQCAVCGMGMSACIRDQTERVVEKVQDGTEQPNNCCVDLGTYLRRVSATAHPSDVVCLWRIRREQTLVTPTSRSPRGRLTLFTTA